MLFQCFSGFSIMFLLLLAVMFGFGALIALPIKYKYNGPLISALIDCWYIFPQFVIICIYCMTDWLENNYGKQSSSKVACRFIILITCIIFNKKFGVDDSMCINPTENEYFTQYLNTLINFIFVFLTVNQEIVRL